MNITRFFLKVDEWVGRWEDMEELVVYGTENSMCLIPKVNANMNTIRLFSRGNVNSYHLYCLKYVVLFSRKNLIYI